MTEKINKKLFIVKNNVNNILVLNRKKISNNGLKEILINLNFNPNDMNVKEMTNKIINLIRKNGKLYIFKIESGKISIVLKYENYYLVDNDVKDSITLRKIYLKFKFKNKMNNNECKFTNKNLKNKILEMHEKNNGVTSRYYENKRVSSN